MFQKTHTFSQYLLKNKKELENEVEDFYSLMSESGEEEDLEEFLDRTEGIVEESNETKVNSEDSDSFFSRENYEGELQVDVYETDENIFLRSAIPGISVDDLDVAVSHDLVTIRGRRQEPPLPEGAQYLFRECFWGNFSRSIVLPVEINTKKISAKLENGILLVRLPKMKKDKVLTIRVKGM